MKELLINSPIKKIDDAQLNQEAAKAACWYVEQQGKHLNMIDTQNMATQVAHGFHMGWIEAEKRLGLRQ